MDDILGPELKNKMPVLNHVDIRYTSWHAIFAEPERRQNVCAAAVTCGDGIARAQGGLDLKVGQGVHSILL